MRRLLILLFLLSLTALPSLADDKLPPPHVTEIYVVDISHVGYGWCLSVEWRHVAGADDYMFFIRGKKKGLMPRKYDGSTPDDARWRRRIEYNNVPGFNDSVTVCMLDEKQNVKFRIKAIDSTADKPAKSGEASAPYAVRLPKFSKATDHPQYGRAFIIFDSSVSS